MDAGQTLQLGIRRLFEAEFPPALRELAHQGRHENLRAARFCGDACSKDHRLAVEVVGFLVTTDQSPQMAAALIAAGVPARLFTVLGNGGANPARPRAGSQVGRCSLRPDRSTQAPPPVTGGKEATRIS